MLKSLFALFLNIIIRQLTKVCNDQHSATRNITTAQTMAFRLMLLIKMYDVTFKSMPGIVPARKLSKTINLLFIKTNHNSLSLH